MTSSGLHKYTRGWVYTYTHAHTHRPHVYMHTRAHAHTHSIVKDVLCWESGAAISGKWKLHCSNVHSLVRFLGEFRVLSIGRRTWFTRSPVSQNVSKRAKVPDAGEEEGCCWVGMRGEEADGVTGSEEKALDLQYLFLWASPSRAHPKLWKWSGDSEMVQTKMIFMLVGFFFRDKVVVQADLKLEVILRHPPKS